MNKEQAKATIESESLLRQEAKNNIRVKMGPVSDNKFADDIIHTNIEPEQTDIIVNEPDDKLAGELYIEAKYQAKRFERTAEGPKENKTDGPSINVKDTKYDIKNDNKNSSKLFKVTGDKLSDAIAIKRKTNTKLTESELRQKAYFANKLESKDAEVQSQISEDDRIVYKTFGRNKRNNHRFSSRNALRQFSSSKYHVNNLIKNDHQNDDESIQDDVMYKASAVRRATVDMTGRMYKGISGKRKTVSNSKYVLTGGTRQKKNEIVDQIDLMIQERKNLLRFMSIRKREEQVSAGIKTSLARKIFSKIKEIATRNKIGVIIGAVSLAFILAAIGSVGVLVEGISQATGVYLSGLSLSTDLDMTECENYYTKKEADLQDVLDNIEEYYPGYDRYVIETDDEIGHDILKLMAYLSAVYEGYDLNMTKNIQLVFQFVSDGKELIASATTDKGITQNKDAIFSVLANGISLIGTDVANVESEKMLEGTRVYDGLNNTYVDGSMPEREHQEDFITSGIEQRTYESGYYPNSWTVDTSNAYNRGYTDGKADVPNANISYVYHEHKLDDGTVVSADYTSDHADGCICQPVYNIHHHSGSPTYGGGCYTVRHEEEVDEHCGGSATTDWGVGYGEYWYCNKCGARMDGNYGQCEQVVGHHTEVYYTLGCGKAEGGNDGINHYRCGCGKKDYATAGEDADIVSATIVYED